MRASLERHCEHRGTIRIHHADNGDWSIPSPYFWTCGCGFNYDGDPECIYLGGYCVKLQLSGWKAVREMLQREKFVWIVWEELLLDGTLVKTKGHIESKKRVP